MLEMKYKFLVKKDKYKKNYFYKFHVYICQSTSFILLKTRHVEFYYHLKICLIMIKNKTVTMVKKKKIN